MTLYTLYAFLAHDVLGNIAAAFLIASTGYTAKKIRAEVRKRNGQTHDTSQ
ncbi:hypothetical protein [Streptomyces sp. NPDC020817]|uniref:hypothetical protein n=1 Tax=Streptomyces sp. NPDC020817 TaxID=3365095 RepID=UPI0037BC0C46